MEGKARLGTEDQFLRYVNDLAYVSDTNSCDPDTILFAILFRTPPSQSHYLAGMWVRIIRRGLVKSIARDCIVRRWDRYL
jgi:hypothetical protein